LVALGGLPAALPKNSVSSETSLMMLSQSEFNAKWAVKFENEYPGGFLLQNGKTKMVTMMEATYPMQHIISCAGKYYDSSILTSLPIKIIHITLIVILIRLFQLWFKFLLNQAVFKSLQSNRIKIFQKVNKQSKLD